MKQLAINALLTLPLVGAYAMFAIGIVVIYRASRVLNLAHGAMATLPAYISYSLVEAGLGPHVAFLVAVGAGALLGIGVERFVLRRLRGESQTSQTVGTVAVLGILIAIIAKIWGTAPLRAPSIFPSGSVQIGLTPMYYADIGIAVFALAAAGAFLLLFQRTEIGLAMRGAAENGQAARLMGINPDRTTALAWALGGALAGASGILLAAATNLHPFTLSRQVLPGFVAALIGGLGSLTGAMAGSVIVGMTQGIVSSVGPLASQPGSAQMVLALVAIGVMAVRGRSLSGTSEVGAVHGVIPAMRVKRRRWLLWVPVLAGAGFLPFIPDSVVRDANVAAIYVVVAVSLVLLTGWVGQISLAQASFVGIAAFTTGILVRDAGIPFPLNLPIAAAVSGLAAAGLGVVALRVRGLYLAVATLIFGWMSDAYLFKSSWLVGAGGSSTITGRTIGRRGAFPSFDLTQSRSFWLVALAAAVLALVAAANIRDSRSGRALFAVRGSELAAASMGIDVTRMKLVAFALSGVLAGIAGNLLMVDQRTASPDQFSFSASLLFLSITAVGGLVRLGGVVAASVGFAALLELYFKVPAFQGYLDIVTSSLLLVAIMASPASARAKIASVMSRLIGPLRVTMTDAISLGTAKMGSLLRLPRKAATHADPPVARAEPPAAPEGFPLKVDGVTVRFGGLTAAEDVTLEVAQAEIVGLIGPNGAGKTTVFNAISGFVQPTEGGVHLFGHVVTKMPVHARASLGLARTFQVLQLFHDATVFDNLLVATHLHSRVGLGSNIFLTAKSLRAEREARESVRAIVDLVGIDEYVDAKAGDLPFGTLRRVDVARALVTGGRLMLLDEPASGLDERET
ncbi:MAG TPA: ATP-binding cassette domain-containing protein, partial [Actinomycetota bacterium]|nr:ATP-binding cassette domain-containing protein [Actinomycetota bacterium]